MTVLVAKATLRGNDDRIAGRLDLRPKRFTQELLGGAEPVGMRGVEQVDPEVEGFPGRCDGSITVDTARSRFNRMVGSSGFCGVVRSLS